jgi:hypothetical protein
MARSLRAKIVNGEFNKIVEPKASRKEKELVILPKTEG